MPQSAATRRVYDQILSAVRAELGDVDFVASAGAVWPVLQTARGRRAANATIRTRVSAVIDHIVEHKGDPSFYTAKLRELFEEADKLKHDPETYKRKESDAKWSELSTMHSKYTGQDRIILALYTLAAAPRRLDYINMDVINNLKHAKDKTKNYLVMNSRPIFVFQAYKTAKVYGKQIIPVPVALRRELIGFAKVGKPLLSNGGKPFTPAQFSDKLRRLTAYESRGGKAYSANDFRHAFITQFLSRNPPTAERLKMAAYMGHSIGTQAQYDRRDDSSSSDGSSSDSD